MGVFRWAGQVANPSPAVLGRLGSALGICNGKGTMVLWCERNALMLTSSNLFNKCQRYSVVCTGCVLLGALSGSVGVSVCAMPSGGVVLLLRQSDRRAGLRGLAIMLVVHRHVYAVHTRQEPRLYRPPPYMRAPHPPFSSVTPGDTETETTRCVHGGCAPHGSPRFRRRCGSLTDFGMWKRLGCACRSTRQGQAYAMQCVELGGRGLKQRRKRVVARVGEGYGWERL